MDIHVRATYRVQLTPTFDLDRAAAMVAVPRPARHQPPLHLAAGRGHAGQHPRLRRHRPEPGAGRSSAASRPCAGSGRPSTRTAWATSLDLVPNHMGIRDPSNRWWQDVLRHGEASAFADHFDIDWSPPDPARRARSCCRSSTAPSTDAVARRCDRGRAGRPTRSTSWSRHHGDRWPVVGGVAGAARPRPRRLRRAGRRRARGPRPVARRAAASSSPPSTGGPCTGGRPARLLNWRRFFDVTDLAARPGRPADGVRRRPRPARGAGCADDLGGPGRAGRAGRPRRRPGRPRGLPRAAAGPGRPRPAASWSRRSSPPTSGCPRSWPVDGTTGYERRWPASTRPSPTPPAPPSCGGWSRRGHRARRRLARARTAVPAPGGRPAPRPGGRPGDERADRRPRARRPRRRSPDAAAVVTGLAVELGVYRTYARPGSAPVDAADRERARPGPPPPWSPGGPTSTPPSSTPPARC